VEDNNIEFDFKTASFIDDNKTIDTELDSTERKEYIIEVDFKGCRKGYYLNSKSVSLKVGDSVIVDCDNGEDMGVVSSLINKSLRAELTEDGEIIRKGNNIDSRRLEENRKIEDKILIDARKQAKLHNLDMKFIDIEYKFDRKKLVFYFTADGRVDFRELVKVFAGEYRTRIELRQIGVRDEAQRIGGIGICGRELCCSKFLKNFVSINVAMARDQNLFVKPEKFSGACGKLMCCLKYEHEFYLNAKKGIPEIGTMIKTTKGIWFVNSVDVFKKTLTLTSSSNDMLVYSFEQVGELIKLLSPNSITNSNNGQNGNNHSAPADAQNGEAREACPTCVDGKCSNDCKVSDIDLTAFKKRFEKVEPMETIKMDEDDFSMKIAKKPAEKIIEKPAPVKPVVKENAPLKTEAVERRSEPRETKKDDRPRRPFNRDQQRNNNKPGEERTPNNNRRPDQPRRNPNQDNSVARSNNSDAVERAERPERPEKSERRPFDKNRNQPRNDRPNNRQFDKSKKDTGEK